MKEYLNYSKIISYKESNIKNKYFNDYFTEKKKDNKNIPISQISSSTIFDSEPEKYTLTKLINSVSNYRKEIGTDFKIDVSTIKPNRLFHFDSYRTIGIKDNNSHSTSFMVKSNYKNISPIRNKILNNSTLNNNTEKEVKKIENEKKTIIDYFPINNLIKMETKLIILISKIKNLIQLKEEFIIWLKEFKDCPFYQFHFIFKNIFDNESPIKENVANLIKNSSNLLIISSITCFWITYKNILNNHIIIKAKNDNIDIKNLYDLMINNHKLYLLLCLFILIEANSINNNDDVYVLRLIEQIKAYLSKTLRNFKNRILVLNEFKFVSKNIVNILNKILNNYNFPELYDYTNNINNVDISRLFEIFDEIKNKKYLNYNSLGVNDNRSNINNMNILSNNTNENTNNLSKRKIYKKINKINEDKANQINNRLYIKKTIPNRQMNNKKVTNKIVNIIINNNNANVNYDNQNQLSIKYNANKNNSYNINYNNKNNFRQELNTIKNVDNSITIKLNNTENYNNINISPRYNKNINFNFNQKLVNTNYKNNMKYNLNNISSFNINNNTYNNSNLNINTQTYNNSCLNINNNYYTNNYNNNYNNNYILKKKQRQNSVNPEPPFLPPKQNKSEFSQKKYTLILDLDETLVRYQINENNQDEAKIIFRPGLFYFLNKVYPLFDIVIWTVATREYADPIIDIIEENKKYFIARLFREHATIKNYNYAKDLTNLGRDINTIIIIDDKEENFSFQKENGILIKPFYGTNIELKKDFILYDLFKILTKILLDKTDDVRNGINKYRYEIKQKITQNSNKNNFGNIDGENKNLYNSQTLVNKDLINNINNIKHNNSHLKNSINNINRNYINNKINRSFSMSDSLGFNKLSKK